MDSDLCIEIWNLVFIQFNRESKELLKPLPAQHVDTGMGLERLVSVVQNKPSNYDTDLFAGMFDTIASITNTKPYGSVLEDPIDVAYRVIADHARCLTAAIADGATPGADGRGYVLRRILRRAVRHGRQTLGMEKPFLARLVPTVVDSLGDVFPVFRQKQGRVQEIIEREEETFRRTLDRGLALFAMTAEQAEADGTKEVPALDAFKLHDTYGFPIDLTQVMAEERGLVLDTAGYESLMEKARKRSRGESTEADSVISMPPDVLAKLATLNIKPTDDSFKNAGKPITATVRAIWSGTQLEEHAHSPDRVGVILDRTPFYGEQGGQQGDTGELYVSRGSILHVQNTHRVGDYVLHICRIGQGNLSVGDEVEAKVTDHLRDEIRKNHTTTHLLNQALRKVAGPESDQRGSHVGPDRLRLDYAASGALTPEQIAEIELIVCKTIQDGLDVHAKEVPLEDAQRINGVRAVFGERYPDPVRVVSVGASTSSLLANPQNEDWSGLSIEFCGGTHLSNTAEAEDFVVVSEQGLAAGIRRVIALSGRAALEARSNTESLAQRIAHAETCDAIEAAALLDALAQEFEQTTISSTDRHVLSSKLDGIRAKARAHQKLAQAETRGAAVEHARTLAEETGDAIVGTIDGADKDGLLAAMDTIRSKRPNAAILLIASDHDSGKVTIVAKVSQDLIARGLKAGDWVKVAAQACGGGGGGRPDSAQAGGKDPSKAEDALAEAKAFASGILSAPS